MVGLNLNSHGQLRFSINYKKSSISSKIGFSVQVRDNGWGWRTLKFNFMATNQRDLFLLGTETATQFSLGLDSNSFAIYKNIQALNNFKKEPIVRIFLAGVDLTGKDLNTDN